MWKPSVRVGPRRFLSSIVCIITIKTLAGFESVRDEWSIVWLVLMMSSAEQSDKSAGSNDNGRKVKTILYIDLSGSYHNR